MDDGRVLPEEATTVVQILEAVCNKKEKQKHVLLNTYHIFVSELAFSLKNVFSIFFYSKVNTFFILFN